MEAEADVRREVRLPGCKSLSARALILAASASGESRLLGLSDSEDTTLLRRALETLGVRMEEEAAAALRVHGFDGPPRAERVEVDVGAAGASFRFLLPWLAAGHTDVVVRGRPRLFERPQEPLYAFLRGLGARVTLFEDALGPGVRVVGRGLPSGDWRPPVEGTSQYLSGLLLAAGFAGEVRLLLDRPAPSRGYLGLTLEALEAFRGPGAVLQLPGSFFVRPGVPRGREYRVPGDPSGATFFLTALVLAGGRMDIGPAWSERHPEAAVLQRFLEEGLLRSLPGGGLEATGWAPAEPLVFDLEEAPDAGPALAVLGAHLPAGAFLERVGRLRFKESDRVQGIERLLALLGQEVHEEGGRLRIPGGGLPAAPLGDRRAYDPAEDHRLAMAAGIASLRSPWLEVRDPGCVAKSFPGFWEQLAPWRTG